MYTGYAQLDNLMAVARTPISYDIVQTIKQPIRGMLELLYTSNTTGSAPLTNQITLAISANTLQPDQMYRFRLQATDSMGHTGYAEIDIYTESVPLLGYLDATPTSGVPLSTSFRLSALGWTDDIGDAPFSYQFGVQYDSEDSIYWLSGILRQDGIMALLPPTSFGSLSAVLFVYDRNGAVAWDNTIVNLESGVGSAQTNLSSLMDSIEVKSVNFGNWIEGLADLTSLALAINKNPHSMYNDSDVVDIRKRGVELVIALYWSQTPASTSFLDHLLVLLRELTKEAGGLPTPTLAQLFGMLRSLIAKYIDSAQTSTLVAPGLGEGAGQTIVDIYANVIEATSQVDGMRVREDVVTESLFGNIVGLGYGVCKQIGIRERSTTVSAPGLATLSFSLTSLPSAYMTLETSLSTYTGYSSDDDPPPISIDFGGHLYEQYLQWPCSKEDDCSGICLTTAQFERNLRWQGNEYAPFSKTPLLSILLVNQANGSEVRVQGLPSSSRVRIAFPLTGTVADSGLLSCVVWDANRKEWTGEECSSAVVSVVKPRQPIMCCA